MARLSTDLATSRSGGSPHIPEPVIRIAPKPSRLTVRSPPMPIVPGSAVDAASVMDALPSLWSLRLPSRADASSLPHFIASRCCRTGAELTGSRWTRPRGTFVVGAVDLARAKSSAKSARVPTSRNITAESS